MFEIETIIFSALRTTFEGGTPLRGVISRMWSPADALIRVSKVGGGGPSGGGTQGVSRRGVPGRCACSCLWTWGSGPGGVPLGGVIQGGSHGGSPRGACVMTSWPLQVFASLRHTSHEWMMMIIFGGRDLWIDTRVLHATSTSSHVTTTFACALRFVVMISRHDS